MTCGRERRSDKGCEMCGSDRGVSKKVGGIVSDVDARTGVGAEGRSVVIVGDSDRDRDSGAGTGAVTGGVGLVSGVDI